MVWGALGRAGSVGDQVGRTCCSTAHVQVGKVGYDLVPIRRGRHLLLFRSHISSESYTVCVDTQRTHSMAPSIEDTALAAIPDKANVDAELELDSRRLVGGGGSDINTYPPDKP